ncbi:phage tail tape measure protein [Paenibacillus harenae]|uniref:Phage-related minor tail protein/SLT domain-containing protein n=1 Tax=Paenibacillus harenae TaxID=306543 RepID=A0ABT9U6M9_PAEHA|nr:phage tail tape measure protein [Paenibacillus harenae]MDQ0114355.1 phage-related minor tail protein/SLT domain-containing protein [Paenibacillus harenae]
MASGKVYKIAFELAAKLEGSYTSGMTRALSDLSELETKARAINAIRISGDMVRPLREGLQHLERDFREIRNNPIPNGMFGDMNTQLREAVQSSRALLQNLRQIATIRMPGNMFGNDMTRYLREVTELEQRMRALQNAGGPNGGGGGNGGGGSGGGAGPGGVGVLGGAAMVAGGAALAAGAGIGMAGAAVYSFADEYQVAMAQIQTSTGATEAAMGDFGKITQNIYNQSIGENFYDIAESLSRVEQVTKLSGAALESTAKNAMAFRDTFGEDVTESVKAADTMMKNFGVTSDQAYNLLAQGAQNGLNKSNELLDSANEYAPHFATLGFSAGEMFDTFGAGLEAGAFNLDKVGDAVKEFNIRSKDMSKTSVDAYTALGMNAEKMSQTFAAGGPAAQEAFRTVAAAISSVEDPVKKNAIGVGLFGTQFEDLEAGVIEAMGTARGQFDMTKDTMGEITKIKYDTIGKAFQGIGRQLQTGLLLPISNAALPLLEKLSTWLQDKLPQIQEWFGKIGDAIGPAFEKISGIVSGVFGSFGDGADESQSGMSSYIAALMENFALFRDFALEVWNTVGPHVMKVIGSIGAVIKQVIPIVTNIATTFQKIMKHIISAIMPVVKYLLSKLWPVLAKIFDFIAKEVMPEISAVIAALLPKIEMIAGKIGSAVTDIFNFFKPVLDALFIAFDIVFPLIKSIVVNAFKAIGGVLSGVFDVLGGVIDFVTGVFTGNWEKAWQGVGDIFEGIFNALGSVLTFPINLAIDAINTAIRAINKVSFDVPDWLGGGTFGVDIPEIPKINGYAEGGYVTRPELAWVGEGKSNEWIIPENNSQRSRSLLQAANSSMGMTTDGGGGGDFVYKPVYNFNGPVDKAAVEQMDSQNHKDFARQFEDYKRQQRRVSMA